LAKEWGIRKFNLDDLYVRFFRLAERRIAEKTGKGIVCFISNYSYLGDPSFVVMRQRFLKEFDSLWFDCLNGDSRETGKLNWRVEKMSLSKDKTQLKYNDFLTLSGIPPEVYEYRLGNRSALEWVVDQYRVSTDKRSGIVNDPNRADDSEYIVRLIGQVVTVSLETVRLVRELSALRLLNPEA
jgi:predicted helicase